MKNIFAKRTENAEPSIIREMLKLSLDPSYISFAGGDPDPDLFPDMPEPEICKMTLQYGISEGDDDLRKAIASHMKKYNVEVIKENILVTTGSQQALDLTGKLFLDEGDVVIVERPTYMGAINAFRQYYPRFVDVEMDSRGMNTKKLESALETNPDAKFIYVIPDFQNPTGATMSFERRKKLLKLAQKYEIPIVEDSPYYELRYDEDATVNSGFIPTIKSMDTDDLVIYLGSFSKTVCPGLRVGWITASEDLINKYVVLKQAADMHTNSISQRQILELIGNSDFEKHLDGIRDRYAKKRDAIVDAIKSQLPGYINYSVPQGGLFIWIELPSNWTGEDLMEECIKEKVAIIPGSRFYVGSPKKNTIRLSFATMDENSIREGIGRIKNAMNHYERSVE